MSAQDELRSARDIDADAERFVDPDVDETEAGVTNAVDLPPEGSVADIIDQHVEVPTDDEP
jgi:hypothetical protein